MINSCGATWSPFMCSKVLILQTGDFKRHHKQRCRQVWQTISETNVRLTAILTDGYIFSVAVWLISWLFFFCAPGGSKYWQSHEWRLFRITFFFGKAPALNVHWCPANQRFLTAQKRPTSHGESGKRSSQFPSFLPLSSSPPFAASEPPIQNHSSIGELQSVTVPQQGTIRLILAGVAPNLAAQRRGRSVLRVITVGPVPLFGRQKGSATNVCLPGW